MNSDASRWLPQVVPIVPPPIYCKKRKLAEFTSAMFTAKREFTENTKNKILEQQAIAFHEYENEVQALQRKLIDATEKHRQQVQQNYNINIQLSQRQAIIAKKQSELNEARSEILSLTDQLDVLSIRVFEADQAKEEKETYYREMINNLQKTAANAEEASLFMRFLHQSLIEYQNGCKVEELVHKTNKLCSICLSEPANIMAKPCHHLEWCRGCAIDFFSIRENCFETIKTETVEDYMKSCPRCKTDIVSIDFVYL